jgi:hypothetical protein
MNYELPAGRRRIMNYKDIEIKNCEFSMINFRQVIHNS